MDPIEVREERVVGSAPVAQVAPTTPVAAVPTTERAYGAYSTRSVYPVAYRSTQLVWFVVGLINAILGLDFVFRLLKANDTGFVDLIYGVGGSLAAPFDGVFSATINRTSYVTRWADLVAILVYTLIGFGIVKLILIFSARNAPATRVQ